MSIRNDYACSECKGWGVGSCPECECERDCPECGGTGLDDLLIDVSAFNAAHKALIGMDGTWDWIEDGVVLGRRNKDRVLAYADFARPGAIPVRTRE